MRLAITMCTSFWRNNLLPCLYIPTLWIYILLNEGESEAFGLIDCLVMKRGNFLLGESFHSHIHISAHELPLSVTLWFHLAQYFVPLYSASSAKLRLCQRWLQSVHVPEFDFSSGTIVGSTVSIVCVPCASLGWQNRVQSCWWKPFARLSCTHIPNPLGAQKAITLGAYLRNIFTFFFIDIPPHLLSNSVLFCCIRKFTFCIML